MHSFGKIIISFFVAILMLTFGSSSVVLAQSQTNAIALGIAKINQLDNGKISAAQVRVPDTAKPNAYTTDAKITPDDDIRYRWTGFVLDVKNVDTPVKTKNGYIKVYAGTESKTENFIVNAGTNLPIKDIKNKLKEGSNTILLQVVTNDGKPLIPTTEVTLTFNFSPDSSLPAIDIVSPKPSAILAPTITQDFDIKTPNFTLVNDPTAKITNTSGKMAIYWDEVKPEKLIATIYQNKFKSTDYDFSKIEDGLDRKLIFVLKDSKDNEYKPSIQSTLNIKANFKGTVDIGLPKITIISPDKSATNTDLKESDKIVVKIDNFSLTDNTSDKTPEDGKGVLQVSIDGKKIPDIITKTEFTLGELNIGSMDKGQKEITVELVSKNFEKLNPVTSDSIKFNFIPSTESSTANTNSTNIDDTQNPAWKIVIVVLIVILIIGGIAVLITKA